MSNVSKVSEVSKVSVALAGVVLVLVACGSPGTDSPPVAGPVPTTAVVPTDDTAAPIEPIADSTIASGTPTTASEEAGATAATAATEEPEQAPATTAAPEARAADGCSADNSPTEPDVADGPAPAIEVRAAAAAAVNPLPDLAVRRINCDGGWVNLKNELPGALPLLVWFWAPH